MSKPLPKLESRFLPRRSATEPRVQQWRGSGWGVLDASRAQLAQQVAAGRTAQSKGRALRKSLRTYVLGTYGTHAVAMLQDFGMSPPKTPGPVTVKVKAEAVTKSKATREARDTMGKKQKLSVKGAPAASTTPTHS